MATKIIQLANIGPVRFVKRSGNKSIRLSVTPHGVRVSMPTWTPFSAGQAFALKHSAWIQAELAKQSLSLIQTGQRIGKLHYVRFEQVLSSQSISSRVTGTEIIIRMQTGKTTEDIEVQARANKACLRALKREAEQLLSARLTNLAEQYQKNFTSVGIKQLKRRWGSCDSHRVITLNMFLMELPWEYIDYVLLHELAHTVEMNHGPAFWEVLTSMQPRARDMSRQLHSHQPVIGTWQIA